MRLRILVVALLFTPARLAVGTDRPLFAVAPSVAKIRPALPLPMDARVGGEISLKAARGECEAAHLIVTASPRPTQQLEASATPLTRTKKTEPGSLRVSLYREAFLDVATPSDTEGATGLWPDPLIPVVDDIVGEKRNAFPVDVPAGLHQPIFVEVCVPREIAPGNYVGSVAVTAAQKPLFTVPISVQVQAAAIPATSSIPVTFGASGKSLLFGHFGEKRKDDERLKLVEKYAKAALKHRISLHSMSMIPPAVVGEGSYDFSKWDAEIAPFMDGTALPNGARFSAIDLRTPPDLSDAQLGAYYAAVVKHFKERGWDDRLFSYVMDEPKPDQMAELVRRLDRLAPYHETIRRLVTTPFQKQLAGKVDTWVPNINCLAYKQKPNEFCAVFTPLSAYSSLRRQGEKLWWYQSCSSHGCKQGPFGSSIDRYFTGWPSYMVDIEGGANRIMGWQTFANDVGGELYFDVAYAYNGYEKSKSPRVDPWNSVWAFGGNGDGTLFYPGRPDRIGGKTDIPVESLRLKLIRDGLEDYELLRLLSGRGPKEAERAKAIASRMAPSLFKSDRSPAAFERARAELLEQLAKSGTLSAGDRQRNPTNEGE